VLVGPVRQELLSGLKDLEQFERLRSELRAFDNEALQTDDYEVAASMYNICRRAGIQGSNTDFLLCSLSLRIGASIYTLDRDFEAFAKLLQITLFYPEPHP
jgi:predicted nucleic acid-binding protein